MLQARAKLELRMEATESDALDVIDILRYALTDTVEDSYTIPKLHSDGKLTSRKVNHMCICLCVCYLNLYKKCLNIYNYFLYL